MKKKPLFPLLNPHPRSTKLSKPIFVCNSVGKGNYYVITQEGSTLCSLSEAKRYFREWVKGMGC